jgi:hypothetical protein
VPRTKAVIATIGVAAVLTVAGTSNGASVTDEATRDQAACAPGYRPCLPIRADLDSSQITDASKPVRVTDEHRYSLDVDDD